MAETATTDMTVVGAGIAGAAIASELARQGLRVALVERESQPGYHSTGRSAALFSETYGPEPIRALSRASGSFFRDPPEGFTDHALIGPRGVMMVARADQADTLDRLAGEVAHHEGVSVVDAAQARRRMPLLREGYATGALFERDASDIDVHALHHGFLRRFRAAGGTVMTDSTVRALSRGVGGWLVETRTATIRSDVVVNAAGAWADELAVLAGAAPVGLVPKRRTAIVVDAPRGPSLDAAPMTVDIGELFYLKPDAGRLLISPADETPTPPCDAQPDEMDVALCVDRIQTAFDLEIRRVDNKWAGLRSFVADKAPVAGYDPETPGFFWLAGQGGYGIQTAPALARTATALVAGRPVPSDIADHGVRAADLDPGRLATGRASCGSNDREPQQVNGR